MRDPRVSLKSPVVAGLLAFVMPGAGHWYQGRRFKATIFSVCILTVFLWGMLLGNLQPVYSQVAHTARATSVQMEKGRPTSRMTFGYYAQLLVGGPALPALIQQERFRGDEGVVERLDSILNSDFIGVIRERGEGINSLARTVQGQVHLEPANPSGSRVVRGLLKGRFDDGQEIELTLGGEIRLGREVFGSPRRELVCSIMDPDGSGAAVGALEGTVKRSVFNWFQAPRDNAELDRLHGELGRTFDMASVFTWIAGLLNLLVIWDAVDGPAYGYGDEKPDEDDSAGTPPKS